MDRFNSKQEVLDWIASEPTAACSNSFWSDRGPCYRFEIRNGRAIAIREWHRWSTERTEAKDCQEDLGEIRPMPISGSLSWTWHVDHRFVRYGRLGRPPRRPGLQGMAIAAGRMNCASRWSARPHTST